MPWYHSVAVKSFLVAFVATHIPLLGLIAWIALSPGSLTPLTIFVVALLYTLAATALVITVLWRLFRPLRLAADGLHLFMTRGASFQSALESSDEIGRLVRVLVSSLAHLSRSRTPMLLSSAQAVSNASAHAGTPSPARGQWLALLEIDQWARLDGSEALQEMLRVHQALGMALEGIKRSGELVIPWGRGRFLMVCSASPSSSQVEERLEPVCKQVLAGGDQTYTATAVLDIQSSGNNSRAATLQRLEHKLFAARMRGLVAAVA